MKTEVYVNDVVTTFIKFWGVTVSIGGVECGTTENGYVWLKTIKIAFQIRTRWNSE